jgi:hypothetical protein
MVPTEAVVEGTLNADGTLDLDEKPNLVPGRVRVLVQSMPTPPLPKHGLVEVMDEIRSSQLARGYHGRTAEEMQAEERAREEEDAEYDRRWERLWSQGHSASSEPGQA